MSARVLVVDDEPDLAELVRLNLELLGHEPVVARNGVDALAAIRDGGFELIVLDVMMPGLDGYEVLRQVKADADPAVRGVPVLLLTAKSDDIDRIRGGIEGAVRYLTKPFSLNTLGDAVHDALNAPEAQQRRAAQTAALEQLARLERGETIAPDVGAEPAARVHLARLERAPEPRPAASGAAPLSSLDVLSPKQRELIAVVGRHATVRDAAADLGVSRSNVYASLRRIGRKLGITNVSDLVDRARAGQLV